MNRKTKTFPLRTVLTVTTGRLLTEQRGPRDNGIGDLYDILGWMTDDQPFTHQLPRFGDECKPWLLRWFPELAACGVAQSLDSLDAWIACDNTGGSEGVTMWLAELKLMFPALKDEYDVPRIPKETHEHRHPVEELVAMRGSDEGVVVATVESTP